MGGTGGDRSRDPLTQRKEPIPLGHRTPLEVAVEVDVDFEGDDLIFSLIFLVVTYGRTDIAAYRDARTHLKTERMLIFDSFWTIR